ncbi:MAG: hypothetical protein U1A78_39100 [Polyangia bacterium]
MAVSTGAQLQRSHLGPQRLLPRPGSARRPRGSGCAPFERERGEFTALAARYLPRPAKNDASEQSRRVREKRKR